VSAVLLFITTCAATAQTAQDIADLKVKAESGDAKAQFQLGRDYVLGDGVPQDFAQASLWYRRAADQGFAEAQSSLGSAYRLGLAAISHTDRF
jgi:TPR repeat protein